MPTPVRMHTGITSPCRRSKLDQRHLRQKRSTRKRTCASGSRPATSRDKSSTKLTRKIARRLRSGGHSFNRCNTRQRLARSCSRARSPHCRHGSSVHQWSVHQWPRTHISRCLRTSHIRRCLRTSHIRSSPIRRCLRTSRTRRCNSRRCNSRRCRRCNRDIHRTDMSAEDMSAEDMVAIMDEGSIR
jgi:hypothetical protein